MEGRTVVNMQECPGGPRAAAEEERWPQPLRAGERETASHMNHAKTKRARRLEAEEGLEDSHDLEEVQRTGLILLDSTRSMVVPNAFVEIGDLSDLAVRANLVGINAELAAEVTAAIAMNGALTCQEQRRLVAPGAHRLGSGGTASARASARCRL